MRDNTILWRFSLAYWAMAFLTACGSPPLVTESWRMVEVLSAQPVQETVPFEYDVSNCVEPDIDKRPDCSADVQRGVSVDFGGGITVKVLQIEASAQASLGFGGGRGDSIGTDRPPPGYVYRYHMEEVYTFVTGQAYFVSASGNRRDGDYVYHASCIVRHARPKDVLTCEQAITDPPLGFVAATQTAEQPSVLRELDRRTNRGDEIDLVFIADADTWYIGYGNGGYIATGMPEGVLAAASKAKLSGAVVRDIELGPDNSWIVLYGRNGFTRQRLPNELEAKLVELNSQGREINDVYLGGDGSWLVIYDQTGGSGYNMPPRLYEVFSEAVNRGSKIKRVEVAPEGYWIILYDRNGHYFRRIPDSLMGHLAEIQDSEMELKDVIFTEDGGWLMLYGVNSWYSQGVK